MATINDNSIDELVRSIMYTRLGGGTPTPPPTPSPTPDPPTPTPTPTPTEDEQVQIRWIALNRFPYGYDITSIKEYNDVQLHDLFMVPWCRIKQGSIMCCEDIVEVYEYVGPTIVNGVIDLSIPEFNLIWTRKMVKHDVEYDITFQEELDSRGIELLT